MSTAWVDRATADAASSEYMLRALELASAAARAGEVPVGAVLVRDQEILAEAFNSPISLNDPTAHAEILAVGSARSLRDEDGLNHRVSWTEDQTAATRSAELLRAFFRDRR